MPKRGNAAGGNIFTRAGNAIRNVAQRVTARVTGRGNATPTKKGGAS